MTLQLDQPRLGVAKSASAIEVSEVRLEINMQPVRTAPSGKIDGIAHQTGGQTLSTKARMDTCVEDKGMIAAIPGNVHKAHRPVVVISHQMPEAARQDVANFLGDFRAPSRYPKLVELGARRKRVNSDLHGRKLRAGPQYPQAWQDFWMSLLIADPAYRVR